MKEHSGSSSIADKELSGSSSIADYELTGNTSFTDKKLTGDSTTEFEAPSGGGFESDAFSTGFNI